MFRITITDLRTSQSETFSADIDKAKAVKDLVRLKSEPGPIDPEAKVLGPHPDEFLRVARRDITGQEIIEDVKFIEYMDGQRLMQLRKEDVFTPESKGVSQQPDGSYILILRLDPSRHQGLGAKVIKLIPKV